MGQYCKNYVWEYLMCVVIAALLLVNAAQGFYIPDEMADSVPLALGICALLMGVFYLGGYKKVLLLAVPLALAVCTVLAFLLLRRRGVDIVDEPGSGTAFYIYWFAFVVICIVVFLCSRTRIGVALLFLIGCFFHASLRFLDFQVYTWAGAGFAAGCLVLFLLRQYRSQAMNSSTASPRFQKVFFSGVVMVLAAAGLSLGIFFAVIRPLNPPTVELKFIERYLAFQILEHTGISDSYQIPDENEYSNRTDGSLDGTEDTTEGETPLSQDADTDYQEEESQTQEAETEPQMSGITAVMSISYTLTPLSWIILLSLLILLVLVLPPSLRIWLRKRKMKRFAAMKPKAQILALYAFYLKKFRKLGCPKRSGETPFEYAERYREKLGRYLTGTCGMDGLTEAFVAARYGGEEPTPRICRACQELYERLLKNYKAQHGRLRYLAKFYVL